MENITINTDYGYQELKPKDGFLITSFKEGVDDPSTYYSSLEIDAPMSSDISMYHTVTLEQDKIYMENKEKALKANNTEL